MTPRGPTWTRWLTRSLAAVVVLLLLAAGGAALWLEAGVPQTTGSISVAGLNGAVTITRDAHGIPTIRADTARDAWFALGFVHAQERLFQMDLERRLAGGRLAEIFGSQALPIDRQMRTLGLYRSAVVGLNAVSPEFHAVLDAYAAGINAFLDRHSTLPPEFTLLGYRPEPWKAEDSLAFGKLYAVQLAGNYRRELLRARAAATLPAAEVDELFPDYPKDGPVALQGFAALYRTLPLERMLAGLPSFVGPTAASNDWVVDGAHSATGKPLLANDPHLDFSAPGTWYLARLEAPGLDVVGGTIAGAPVVVLGHNPRIAWGYTTTNGDVEDLFIERADPTDPARYVTPDGSAPFDTRTETIKVKGASDTTITIRTTRHGPVISDAATAGTVPGDQVLALAASYLGPDDRSVEAQWRIDQAQNWDDFTAALKLFTAPEQNMVYADVDGNIGFYAPGKLPIRKSGTGEAPVPGWTGAFDWTGWIPFEDLPHAFNPASGRIATANNKIVPDNYPYLITKDWDLPFRAERIDARLAAVPQQSIAASAAIQGDDISLTAETLLPLFLAVPPSNEAQQKIYALMTSWNHAMDRDRPEPLIFSAWLRALNRRIASPTLGTLFPAFIDANPLFIEAALTRNRHWCGTAAAGSDPCAAQVAAALDDALAELSQAYGPDPASWRWGTPHQAFFAHPLFSRVPVLHWLYDRSIAADGGRDTVNAGVFHDDGLSETPYRDVHGPGFRAIYDLADLENSVFMIAPGQSDHLLSGHYDDLERPWRDFQWLHLPRGGAGDQLTLTPQR